MRTLNTPDGGRGYLVLGLSSFSLRLFPCLRLSIEEPGGVECVTSKVRHPQTKP